MTKELPNSDQPFVYSEDGSLNLLGIDKDFSKNLAAKKIMAAELAAMDLSKESISRLLNLEDTKGE